MKRTEKDLLGTQEVANHHRYGIQTQRAIERFESSGAKLGFYKEFMHAFTIAKKTAATANMQAGVLDKKNHELICMSIYELVLRDQLLIKDELDRLLEPANLTSPNLTPFLSDEK